MSTWTFNAQTVPPQMGLEALPTDWYKVAITKTQIRPNSKGDGGLLALTCTVLEGSCKDRVWVKALNMWNQNAQAVEIAQRELSAICHVTGTYQLTSNDNSEDQAVPMLHNKPFFVHLVPQKGDARYNDAIGYKDINGNDPGKQGAAPSMPQTTVMQPAIQAVPAGYTPQPTGPAPAAAPAWGAPQQAQPQQQPGWTPGAAPAAPAQPQGSWQPGAPTQTQQPQPAAAPGGWTPGAQQTGGAPVAPWQK